MAAAGVNLQTLRYYERRGPLAELVRSLGGHGLYSDEAVTVSRMIKTRATARVTLDEAAELLATARHHHQPGDGTGLWRRAREKLVDVEQRITDLLALTP